MDSPIADRVRIKGTWTFTHLDARGRVVAREQYENLICVGMDTELAAWLNGEAPAWSGLYIAVGTGAATPAYTDTQLLTENTRVAVSSNERAVNVTTWSGLFSTAQANATLTECGAFIGATAVANSGTLLNHALITETKTSAVSLLVQVAFTIN